MVIFFAAVLISRAFAQPAQEPVPTRALFLSEHPELIVSTGQSWGELGRDVAAHQPGVPGTPLKIGERDYQKGLGHHANGTILILLEGRFDSFSAEVGLQPCAGGSVLFRVFVDGEQRFDSGIMRSGDSPKPLHVNLAGGEELLLEATDAGDAISCDMANWAEARLITDASPRSARAPAAPSLDIAPYARVVTWDPNRMDGARASRIEEFRAGDIYTETALQPDRRGIYTLDPSANGLACIGLQWLNRRAFKELGLEFPADQELPLTSSIHVQAWVGESAWQGNWKTISGNLHAEANRLTFRPGIEAGIVQAQKVRWVLPGKGKLRVANISALSRSPTQSLKLLVAAEPQTRSAKASISIYNGEFVGPAPADWKLSSEPLRLTVRCSRANLLKSDPPVLCFTLPTGSLAVAIEDVLSNDCVYLPQHGLYVTRDPAPISPKEYSAGLPMRKRFCSRSARCRIRPLSRPWPEPTTKRNGKGR